MRRHGFLVALVGVALVGFVLVGPGSPASAQTEDIAAMEARIRDLFDKKAWTRPPGDNVVDACKDLIRLDPTNATCTDLLQKIISIYLSGGKRRLASGDYNGAAGNFQVVLGLDSSNETARKGLAEAKEGAKRGSFRVEPNQSPEFYLEKANELFDAGNYERARLYYQAILKQLPDDPFARVREQECARKLGLAAGAPDDPDEKIAYYREVAAELEKAKEWEPAASYYRQILEVHPDDPEARSGLNRAEAGLMGAGTIEVMMTGDPFWWSDKAKSASEAKENLTITVELLVDGQVIATETDSVIEQLALGDVSRNDLAVGSSLLGRFKNPGSNTVALRIRAGEKTFMGQFAATTSADKTLRLQAMGSSSLKFSGALGLFKRMTGDFTIALSPLP